MFKKLLTSLFFSFLVFQSFSASAYAEEVSVENSGDGAGSENEVTIEISHETNIESSNEADVTNDVEIDANTGDNTVEANVGDVSLETGDITVDVEIINDVNESSIEVEVCRNGVCENDSGLIVTARNSNNGANSQNSISVSFEESVMVEDYKNADIQNSVAVDANTGGNNIGGNVGEVSLKTGDINISVAIGNEANENEIDVSCSHCGGPEDPEDPGDPSDPDDPSDPEEPTGGTEDPGSDPDPEDPSENGEEASSDPGDPAKPYEDPRPGPIFDTGEVLAAATELISGQVLPITGPCEWTYALTFLLFLLAHFSRRLSYRYLYS